MRAAIGALVLASSCAPPFLSVRVGLDDGGERTACVPIVDDGGDDDDRTSVSWTLPRGLGAAVWVLAERDDVGIVYLSPQRSETRDSRCRRWTTASRPWRRRRSRGSA